MDERVLDAQKWLNKTYGDNNYYEPIEENGRTGNVVMEALITGLQIELGLNNITGYFGSQTADAYNANKVSHGDGDSSNNIIKILQHALYCKGYNPTGVTGYFGDNTLKAVQKVQRDAGYTDDMIDDSLNAKVFKEILSCDALILVAGGDSKIQNIQRKLNHDYGSLFDIIPCDGRYGSMTAKALIYAFQKEGGLSVSVINGNFGPATQNIAQNHPQSISSYESNFVKLAKYALYCNGKRRNGVNAFDCSVNDEFTGIFDIVMQEKLKDFQKFTGMLEVTGKIELKEWMSLMISSGYPKRNVLACDTSTQLTETKVKRLVANDFEIVGRYLTGSTAVADKYLTREELNILFNNGLSVFAIYQDEKQYYKDHPEEETTVNYYNYNQGYSDASKAVQAAEKLGISYGETIFFSVDYDFNYYQTTRMILPHFKGISDYIRFNGHKYRIGIYAPRNICERIYNCGYAEMCFVSDMSTGFSGNLGYALPEKWTFDQIREYTQGASDGAFNVDCVAISGSYRGFNYIKPEEEKQPNISSREVADEFVNSIYQVLGLGLNDAAFLDDKYSLEFPTFTVTTEFKIGTSVTVGKGQDTATINIKDGEYEGKEISMSLKVLDEISYDISYSDSADKSFDVLGKVKYATNNGYIEFGTTLLPDNKMKIFYIIHKDSNSEEGLNNYVEIGLEIVTKDNLSDDQKEEYDNYMGELKKYQVKYPEINLKVIYNIDIIHMSMTALQNTMRNMQILATIILVIGCLFLVIAI